MQLTRRSLLASAAPAAAFVMAGCSTTTNPTTGVVSYGLDPAVITVIQNVVSEVAQYTPAIESIAATAAGLFGPTYSALVTLGSSYVNQLETALENFVTNLPAGAHLARIAAKLRATPSGTFKGYVKTPSGYVPVFAQ